MHALKKLARRDELPGAEHVRSAIYTVALATENALKSDPLSPLVDVKHLGLEEAVFLGQMGDVTHDWSSLVAELRDAVNNAEPRLKALCEHICKLVLSKAATANVLEIERAQDLVQARRYGVTHEEIILSLVSTTPPNELGEVIGKVKEATQFLVTYSGRIVKRTVDGTTFLFPTVFGTVLSRLNILRVDEENAAKDKFSYLQRSRLLNELTATIQTDGFSFYRLDEFELLLNPRELRKRLPSLNEPLPTLVFVDPWLPSYLQWWNRYGGFESLVRFLLEKMNETEYVDAIGHARYLLVFLPNLQETLLDNLLLPLVDYEAAQKFLNYLENAEEILRETLERALSTAAVKRVKLTKRDVERIIREKVQTERQIAKNIAVSTSLRAAREAALRFLALYDQFIAYTSDGSTPPSFQLQTLPFQTDVQKKLEGIQSPQDCAAAINAFFASIINRYYTRNAEALERAVYQSLEERVRKRLWDSLNVDDLVESFVQGTQGILPLSGSLIRDIIHRMHGTKFDIPGYSIKVIIHDKTIEFSVEEVEEGREGTHPPLPPISYPIPEGGPESGRVIAPTTPVVAQVTLSNLTRAEALALAELLKEEQLPTRSLKVILRGDAVSGDLTITSHFRNLTPVFNALSAVSQHLKASLTVIVSLKEAMTENEVKERLGSLAERVSVEKE